MWQSPCALEPGAHTALGQDTPHTLNGARSPLNSGLCCIGQFAYEPVEQQQLALEPLERPRPLEPLERPLVWQKPLERPRPLERPLAQEPLERPLESILSASTLRRADA